MPFTVTMPKLSPTMEEGTLTKWHKRVGQKIEEGDLLIEVATDKATVEYQALDEGWLKKCLLAEGEMAVVGQPIAICTATEEENIEGYQPQGVVDRQAPKKVEEEALETSFEEEPVKKKASVQGLQQPAFVPESPLEGYVFEFPTEKLEKRILASPLARRLAKEKSLDLSTVKGSGPAGRIVSEDLKRAIPANVANFGHRELPELAPGTFEEESLSPMRKVIGQRLQESKTFIPHFYVTQEIDAEPLFALREQFKNVDIKLTYNDFIVRAAALALKKHPGINSGFNSVDQKIVRFKTIDIAIAVSVEAGLITPIIRHADYKNVGQLSLEVKGLTQKAREGKLMPEEYRGGSFTISNLGMYGISEFIAVINPPQAAILAIAGILEKPVVKAGQVISGKVMNVTLSADHRVIDGAAAAAFLVTLKSYLENPAILTI